MLLTFWQIFENLVKCWQISPPTAFRERDCVTQPFCMCKMYQGKNMALILFSDFWAPLVKRITVNAQNYKCLGSTFLALKLDTFCTYFQQDMLDMSFCVGPLLNTATPVISCYFKDNIEWQKILFKIAGNMWFAFFWKWKVTLTEWPISIIKVVLFCLMNWHALKNL